LAWRRWEGWREGGREEGRAEERASQWKERRLRVTRMRRGRDSSVGREGGREGGREVRVLKDKVKAKRRKELIE
jgi:hypothetical protein